MFKNGKIGKRLTASFILTSAITSVAAIIGVFAMLSIASKYDSAMTHYGFAQGDVGRAMAEFADARSGLRGAIGYEEAADFAIMEICPFSSRKRRRTSIVSGRSILYQRTVEPIFSLYALVSIPQAILITVTF